MEASSLLSKILASTVLLQQIHGSGYFSLPDSLLLIQAEVSVSKPVLKINHSVLSQVNIGQSNVLSKSIQLEELDTEPVCSCLFM